jgi:myo-inositol 2-dehydrogenase/D-chiro-inositol 1-dehydrogenase
MAPNQHRVTMSNDDASVQQRRLSCAILGCGMMGQEHLSYLLGYSKHVSVDFLCDPHQASLDKCLDMLLASSSSGDHYRPTLYTNEQDLLDQHGTIDLLVIASPNDLHAPQLLRWAHHDLVILIEKPVAVNPSQLDSLQALLTNCRARIWVAMEYRFIPAIAKLLALVPSVVGDIRQVTIRENRYPFLHKIGNWNRHGNKTGDSLVEKCCHFFDLFRLVTRQEATLSQVRALAQRGVNYQDEATVLEGDDVPIIDSAYVLMPFGTSITACLELCMFAEGSRHQEEIIVTGTLGRLEAYLPENKVYAYQRPTFQEWKDRSVPPPPIAPTIYDCSRDIESTSKDIPTHSGYHYGSTAMEWYRLLEAVQHHSASGVWHPLVSLEDGMRAVELGLQATREIVNEQPTTSTRMSKKRSVSVLSAEEVSDDGEAASLYLRCGS